MNTPVGLSREQIARRAARDIADGSYVNLGIGMPELIAGFIPPDRQIVLHTENGLLGMGPAPGPGGGNPELINAGKKQVTVLPGGSFFHQADSFAMIRGGHLDLSVLGALEVAANGDLANWSTGRPGAIPAVGGAMDLVSGVKAVYVITRHCTRDGTPKLVERCSYPLTGAGVVNRIYTDLAVIDVTADGFGVTEVSPGISLAEVAAHTAAPLLDRRSSAIPSSAAAP
ncbi:MAG: 3-oxoacid CoA-transferase subunit B [bacterium]|nr:3-oxoacid CoA-transferase subunit B [Acidimicrobiia bacterium]MCY4651013.1 3-oxoacid CoA-transferase subunit B [bacterium]